MKQCRFLWGAGLICLAYALVGCQGPVPSAPVPQASGPAASVLDVALYFNAEGRSAVVTFDRSAHVAYLRLGPGAETALPLVPSDSGATYGNGPLVLLSKGAEITVERDGAVIFLGRVDPEIR